MLERSQIPIYISDGESLLRAITHPSGVDEMGHVSPLAFRLQKKEKSISLCRQLFEGLIDFLKRAQTFKFSLFNGKDALYGAAELLAGEVRSLGDHIVLEASPSNNFPAHAGIRYKKEDGSYYIDKGKTTDPVESSILAYEMALATIVVKVYDKEGNIVRARAEIDSP